jgi:FkbM family methyltransferase
LKSLVKKLRTQLRSYLARLDAKAFKILLGEELISIVDLGATGGVEPRWGKVTTFLNYFGFEPDSRSVDINSVSIFGSYKLIPNLISNRSEKSKLHISSEEGKSSLYEPEMEFLDRFPNSKRFKTVDVIELDTSTIDDSIHEDIDFIKLDIQGGELNALMGSEKILQSVVGIETEIEFVSLYKNQPLFGELNTYLRSHGFEFFDFTNLRRWERQSLNELGQCVFGDGLYLRSPENILENKYSEVKLRKYISILFLYNRFDLIDLILKLNPNLVSEFPRFMKLLSKKKNRLKLATNLNKRANVILSFLGVEFKSQLIY